MQVKIPGTVWTQYLASGSPTFQSYLGLPEPRLRRFGKGEQAVYDHLDARQADALATHLEVMGYGWQDVDRASRDAAARIRHQIGQEAALDGAR